MKNVARTIMRHRDGVLRWFHSNIANGLIEALKGLVQALGQRWLVLGSSAQARCPRTCSRGQAAKAKARSYRTFRNLKAITSLPSG